MKNPTDDDAYHALFRSYKNANKQIKELQAQLDYERERNANNVANADLQIAELRAEIARLREGGCAREQHTTQYCAEAQRLAGDAAMLDWIADSGFIETVMEGELNVHEAAHWIAYEREVDSAPTVEDYRLALRHIIRVAINAEAAQAAEGE